VAHHAGIGHRTVAGKDAVVGAAQPGHRHADERLIRARLGSPGRLDAQLARSVQDGGLHRAAMYLTDRGLGDDYAAPGRTP